MSMVSASGQFGETKSPGGYDFGVQGWNWGLPMPSAITFFTDNTAKVSDQHGRPIRGAVLSPDKNGNPVHVNFAQSPPSQDDPPGSRKHLASHADVIKALESERIEWQKLTMAGWPQLPYEELKKLPSLPPTPVDELMKIRDPKRRNEAVKVRREMDEIAAKEMEAVGEEE